MANEDGANYSIRDEIREFWSERAATFDQSVGHEIFSEAERAGWHRLIVRLVGAGNGRAALDLASGTGVISHLLHDLGFAVTGADWSEAMLEQARAKARRRGADIRFILRDAENTMEPRGSYDVITTRHLVWTLVDPGAAFAEWHALLRPGGLLLIVDANMGHRTWAAKLSEVLGRVTGRPPPAHITPDMQARLKAIRARLHFAQSMPAEAVVALLLAAGFEAPVIDRRLFDIHWAQARKMTPLRALDRMLQDRYAICVRKPA